MPNLMDAVRTQNHLRDNSKKVIRVCLTKNDLKLSGLSVAAELTRKSEKFFLVRLPVRKLPMLTMESSSESKIIVVDTNSRRKRATSSGFVPKIVLLKGIRALQAAKADNKLFCSAWVGERALKKLNISSADSIGANALQNKCQRLISDKYKNQKSSKASDNVSYSPSPWIVELYPFDGYFVFSYDGDNYRQNYTLNKTSQEPVLDGEAVRVVAEYVPAVSATSLADSLYGDTFLEKTMNQEMTLDKINYSSPALGALAYQSPIVPDGTYYPAGSELARPELRTMLNVREALSIFLTLLKDGMKGPMQNSFSPVMIPTDKFLMNACNEAEIAVRESRRKVNILDFVNWQHSALTQSKTPTKYGMVAGAYGYVGDPSDISTWHLLANSEKTIRHSLKHVLNCDGVPDKKKNAIHEKLKVMLKNYN